MALVDNVPADWIFSAFSIGRNQLPYAALAVLAGGNIRVGLEDNLWLGQGRAGHQRRSWSSARSRSSKAWARRIMGAEEVRKKLKLKKRW